MALIHCHYLISLGIRETRYFLSSDFLYAFSEPAMFAIQLGPIEISSHSVSTFYFGILQATSKVQTYSKSNILFAGFKKWTSNYWQWARVQRSIVFGWNTNFFDAVTRRESWRRESKRFVGKGDNTSVLNKSTFYLRTILNLGLRHRDERIDMNQFRLNQLRIELIHIKNV
jgi:hypothetical protein